MQNGVSALSSKTAWPPPIHLNIKVSPVNDERVNLKYELLRKVDDAIGDVQTYQL